MKFLRRFFSALLLLAVGAIAMQFAPESVHAVMRDAWAGARTWLGAHMPRARSGTAEAPPAEDTAFRAFQSALDDLQKSYGEASVALDLLASRLRGVAPPQPDTTSATSSPPVNAAAADKDHKEQKP